MEIDTKKTLQRLIGMGNDEEMDYPQIAANINNGRRM